jgi:hypothetical protein
MTPFTKKAGTSRAAVNRVLTVSHYRRAPAGRTFSMGVGQKPDTTPAPDSSNILSAILKDTKTGTDHILEYADTRTGLGTV